MNTSTTVVQWEYKVEYQPVSGILGDSTWLNDKGVKGWELVAIADNDKYGGYYIFKRQKTNTNEPLESTPRNNEVNSH